MILNTCSTNVALCVEQFGDAMNIGLCDLVKLLNFVYSTQCLVVPIMLANCMVCAFTPHGNFTT